MSLQIKPHTRRLLFIVSLLLLTVGCDQVTKCIIRETLSPLSRLQYLGDTIVIQRAENPGAFLSLGASLDHPVRFWIFTVAVGLFLILAAFSLFKGSNMKWWTTLSLTLLVGGGIGNLIDRIHKGTVTDFLNIGIGSLRTGIFNIADMAIVFGVIFLLLEEVDQKLRAKKTKAFLR